MKKQIQKIIKLLQRRQTLVAAGLVAAGVIIGLVLGYVSRPKLATGQEIEAARKAIAAQYINESSVACTDTSDPISPSGRIVVFYKYLRVNKNANRAVIRGCNNIDSLLAKDRNGKWVRTNVNVTLDARVNSRWQNECDIADITVTDDVVRPENSSIDQMNLELCKKLKDL